MKIFPALVFLSGVAAKDHPTLPTMWTAETIDPPEGDGLESYMFVAQPSKDNPSAMWSNYTDGADYNCKRLIWDTGYEGSPTSETARYLIGCSAYDCCKESQDANQVEFQIPNVYYANPNKKAEVNWLGLMNVTVFSEVLEADAWEWNFTLPSTSITAYYRAHTQDCDDCVNGVQLVLWEVYMLEDKFPTVSIQFKNYRGIPEDEAAAFKETFYIPEVCQADNLPLCNPEGGGSDAGTQIFPNKEHYRDIFSGSTCTGKGEFCCGAPGGDVDNCPSSARTDDCDAKNDCCCG